MASGDRVGHTSGARSVAIAVSIQSAGAVGGWSYGMIKLWEHGRDLLGEWFVKSGGQGMVEAVWKTGLIGETKRNVLNRTAGARKFGEARAFGQDPSLRNPKNLLRTRKKCRKALKSLPVRAAIGVRVRRGIRRSDSLKIPISDR